jgi:hypothetical protein
VFGIGISDRDDFDRSKDWAAKATPSVPSSNEAGPKGKRGRPKARTLLKEKESPKDE